MRDDLAVFPHRPFGFAEGDPALTTKQSTDSDE